MCSASKNVKKIKNTNNYTFSMAVTHPLFKIFPFVFKILQKVRKGNEMKVARTKE